MQLTKQTDFAFRTLIYLARVPEGELTHIQQICDYYNIPKNHVSKLIVKLAKFRWITAIRGKGGGIALAVPPNEINLAEVVKAIEPNLQPVNCHEPLCRIVEHCRLKDVLAKAMASFLDELSLFTLRDIMLDEPVIINAGDIIKISR